MNIFLFSFSLFLDDETMENDGSNDDSVETMMSSSNDIIHVLRLACIIHVLDFNLLKAFGLRSGPTPSRIQNIYVVRARHV